MMSMGWYFIIVWAMLQLSFLFGDDYRGIVKILFSKKYCLKTYTSNKLVNYLLILFFFMPITIILFIFLPIYYVIKISIVHLHSSPEDDKYSIDRLSDKLRDSIVGHLYFDKDTLPFKPDYNQVIYVESEHDELINDYIQSHYDEIDAMFKEVGFTFCYVPLIVKNVLEREILAYRFPNIGNNQPNGKIPDSSMLLPYLNEKQSVPPCFIHYNEDPFHSSLDIEFTRFQFAPNDKVPLKQQIRWYCYVLSGLSHGQTRRTTVGACQPPLCRRQTEEHRRR
jgi:hypothetical protein